MGVQNVDRKVKEWAYKTVTCGNGFWIFDVQVTVSVCVCVCVCVRSRGGYLRSVCQGVTAVSTAEYHRHNGALLVVVQAAV